MFSMLLSLMLVVPLSEGKSTCRYQIEIMLPEWNEERVKFENHKKVFYCQAWSVEERIKYVGSHLAPHHVNEKEIVIDMCAGGYFEDGKWREFSNFNSNLGGAYADLGKVVVTDTSLKKIVWRNYNWK